jgi:hypothetical protein
VQRAARLVEYDLWRCWPFEDERPGVIESYMPWMDDVATELAEPRGWQYVPFELINHVLSNCAGFLPTDDRLAVAVLLIERVRQNPEIHRALTRS